jgi:hypothetical protein
MSMVKVTNNQRNAGKNESQMTLECRWSGEMYNKRTFALESAFARRKHFRKEWSSRTSADEGTRNKVNERSRTSCWLILAVVVLTGTEDVDLDLDLDIRRINGVPIPARQIIIGLQENQRFRC